MSETIELIWQRSTHTLYAFNRHINVSCNVRNEVNGLRKAHQVIYTIPDKLPYQPRQFPKGTWEVGRPLPRHGNKYLEPFFIPTTAFLEVPVWELTDKNEYKAMTDKKVIDQGYGLHYSSDKYTQGCIKIEVLDDLLYLVKCINNELDLGNKIIITVS